MFHKISLKSKLFCRHPNFEGVQLFLSTPRPPSGTTGTLGARAPQPFELTRPRTGFRGSRRHFRNLLAS